MDQPGDIYALVWGSRLLQRRGAGGFAIFPGSYSENKKLVFRLITPLDDEDGQLIQLAGWERQTDEEVEGEYWSLDVGELHEAGNHLPLRAHVISEEEQEGKDFGFNPCSPRLPPTDDARTEQRVETTGLGQIRETPLLRKRCACGWQVPRQFAFNIRNDSNKTARFHVSLEFACPQCGSTDLLARSDLSTNQPEPDELEARSAEPEREQR